MKKIFVCFLIVMVVLNVYSFSYMQAKAMIFPLVMPVEAAPYIATLLVAYGVSVFAADALSKLMQGFWGWMVTEGRQELNTIMDWVSNKIQAVDVKAVRDAVVDFITENNIGQSDYVYDYSTDGIIEVKSGSFAGKDSVVYSPSKFGDTIDNFDRILPAVDGDYRVRQVVSFQVNWEGTYSLRICSYQSRYYGFEVWSGYVNAGEIYTISVDYIARRYNGVWSVNYDGQWIVNPVPDFSLVFPGYSSGSYLNLTYSYNLIEAQRVTGTVFSNELTYSPVDDSVYTGKSVVVEQPQALVGESANSLTVVDAGAMQYVGSLTQTLTGALQVVETKVSAIADALTTGLIGDIGSVRFPDIPSVTNKFPFSLPWDIYSLFSALYAEPVCPKISKDIGPPFSARIDIDMSVILPEDIMQKIRYLEVVAFSLFLILRTRDLMGGAT